MDAARFWCGERVIDTSIDDLKFFGIDHGPVKKEQDLMKIWPENWETLETFFKIGTQWRTSMSGVVGLDYSVLMMVMDMYDIKDKKAVFEGVQIMESAAISCLNDRGKK